jgi:hypothetical protein
VCNHSKLIQLIGRQICCDAQRGISYNDVVGCDPQTVGLHEAAGVHHPSRHRMELVDLVRGARPAPALRVA